MIDIRDQVGHLGKAHSSLVLLCFALLVVTTTGRPSTLEKALRQLDTLEQVVEAWDPAWIEAGVNASLPAETGSTSPPDPLPVECSRCSEPDPATVSRIVPSSPLEQGETTSGIVLQFENLWSTLPLPQPLLDFLSEGKPTVDPADKAGPLWARMKRPLLRDPQFLQPNPMVFPLQFTPLAVPAPTTLERFETLWSLLATIELDVCQPARPPFWVGLITQTYPFEDLRPAETTEESWPNLAMRLEPMEDAQASYWRDRTEHELQPTHHYVGFTRWGMVSAPVECKMARVDLQQSFLAFYELDWPIDSFSRVFPELTSASIQETDLSLDKLRAVLESRRMAEEKEIEILGVRIPELVLARLAIPILLAMQFYLLLHLRALRRLLAAQPNATLAPWIGILPDRLSRVTTAITAFMAPALVVAVLVLRQVQETPVWWLTVVASGALAAASLSAIRSVWAGTDSKDRPVAS